MPHITYHVISCVMKIEFILGRILGRGGYCVVKEILEVYLQHNNKSSSNKIPVQRRRSSLLKAIDSGYPEMESFSSGKVIQDRDFISRRYMRNGDARYAMKKISESVIRDKSKYESALIDLVIEVKLLSVLKHTNIIKMRAIYEGDYYSTENFIVLDRLYDTLSQRFPKWKKEKSSMKAKLMPSVKRELFETRFLVARDLCSAFVYLHKHK